MKLIRSISFAALGGLCGGSLVGLGEALLVAATGSPEELWLFPFGILSYGAFGLAAGVGVGVLLALARVAGLGRGWSPLGLAAALAFLPLGFAIGRYHVMQRVFQEGVAFASATGIAVHLGLLLAAVVVAAIVYVVLRSFESRRVAWVAGGWAAVLAASTLVAAASGGGDEATVERRTDPAVAGRPNIVVFMLDTLRADAIDAHLEGDGGVAQLARDGMRFTNAHAQASWTRPSIASLFTSLYPSQHGAVHKTSLMSDRVVTFAETLADAGYWTAGFTTNINLAPIFNLHQGFREFSYLEPSFYFGATDSATRLAIYKGLRVVREWLFRDRIYFQNYYQDAIVVGDAVTDWLAQDPPEPFLLFVHYMDPHDPYFEMPYNGRGVARVIDQNPDPARAEELHELYGEGVDYVEHHLGRLLETLREHGHYDDTAIVVTSDHGEEFQDHEGWWHGTTLYQEQLLVPLVVKLPKGGPSGVDDRIVELVDVAPTLLRVADVPAPRSFVGTDLFAPGERRRVYAEGDHEGNRLVALRDGDWKIVIANPDNPRGLAPVELYDLARDPGEENDLAAAEGERVAAMTRAINELRASLPRAY